MLLVDCKTDQYTLAQLLQFCQGTFCIIIFPKKWKVGEEVNHTLWQEWLLGFKFNDENVYLICISYSDQYEL